MGPNQTSLILPWACLSAGVIHWPNKQFLNIDLCQGQQLMGHLSTFSIFNSISTWNHKISQSQGRLFSSTFQLEILKSIQGQSQLFTGQISLIFLKISCLESWNQSRFKVNCYGSILNIFNFPQHHRRTQKFVKGGAKCKISSVARENFWKNCIFKP